ncbi:cell division septal protein [Desulfosporosinus orientis DSM 765]|uniref:Cell division septal protein n=1 Tax=Desulfosporosinus orientis (strain ATCC 19365 / DSM 765 / NCIMB 8382 / VKM B-1628 / Singapore I) TaxID=768706 RepID=G7WHC5_DESOD|nr:FtsQ-type POTRA domain-containing protein [Desulfosporosinus orientis]AET70215.1 cell division septal protein [Desulfosporosinus orientis DSM 765]
MEPKKMNTSFLYVAVLTILLSLGLALFLRSSAFAIQHVTVEGLSLISENEILKLSDGIQGQNLLLFDRKALQYKISLHPLVQSVEFRRKLPNSLIIQVSERIPAALVVVPKGVLEVDSEGTFLRRLESWPEKDYPVISGIELPDTVGPGQNLSNALLKAALQLVNQAPPNLIAQIGEVHVNAVEQITLFLRGGVEVRLGQANDWKDKSNALYQLISDSGYTSIQQGVRYIDFTAAKPVIGR